MMSRPLPTLLLAFVLLGLARDADAARLHGVTLSTHRSGQDWAGPGLEPALDDMREVGVDWIAIHPYARIADDGTVSFRPIDPLDPPDWLRRPIEEAHARGMRVLIKPHLAYWGSRFAWRGEIRFDDATTNARFFAGYQQWITALAAASTDADAFCVGTELDATAHHETSWRAVIASVRAVTALPLCYAANWTHYREIPFWDAVDVIGIQAYFPISTEPQPTEADLRAGWSARLAELRAFSLEQDRHIVFTELGYNRSFRTAAEPWSSDLDGPEAEPFQALCTRVALESIEAETRVIGSFLWKWFPYPRPVGRDFQLASPAMRASIASVWNPPGPAQGGD